MSQPDRTIAQLDVTELRSLALHTQCRYLSACYAQMANAKEALALGDRDLAAKYLERSKRNYLLSQEVEASKVSRTMRDIEARGGEVCEVGVHRGIGSHTSMRDQYKSDGSRRSLATSASEVR